MDVCRLLRELSGLSDIVLSTCASSRKRFIPYLRAVVSISIVLLCEHGSYIAIKKKAGRIIYLDYEKITNRLLSCFNNKLNTHCERCNIPLPDKIRELIKVLGLGVDPLEVKRRVKTSFKRVISAITDEVKRRKLGDLGVALEYFLLTVYRGEIVSMADACVKAIRELKRALSTTHTEQFNNG